MALNKSGFNITDNLVKVDRGKKNNSETPLIPANKVKPSPFNKGLNMDTVNKLAESMKVVKLIEPISVYACDDGTYEIISGHQRFEAWCKVLGHDTIAANVKPWEPDQKKRFIAHTDANIIVRNKDIDFWVSRIEFAEKILADEKLESDRAKNIRIGELFDVSGNTIYKYRRLKDLIPELKELERNGWLSGLTLYDAMSLDLKQQKEVAKLVKETYDEWNKKNNDPDKDFEISKETFRSIIKRVKEGKTGKRERKRATYYEKLEKAGSSFLKTYSKPKTAEEKSAQLETLEKFREQIDELIESLK